METLPPQIVALEAEIMAAFPDATVGGDVDSFDAPFWVEVTRHEADRQADVSFWIVYENPSYPYPYGIAHNHEDLPDLYLNTRCDRYFATFEEAREQFWELLRKE